MPSKNTPNTCPHCNSGNTGCWVERAVGNDMNKFTIVWGLSCRECGRVSYVQTHYAGEPFLVRPVPE